LLAACDLVALTSHNEASPVSILEALSAGCPVVATNVGSVHETVVDGETGRLIPAGDLDAFAAASIALLTDSDARRRIGAAGRERVQQRWSLAAMVAGYEQLIERIHRAKTAAPANGTCVADLAPRPARRAFR
jgi:glycosyltransferase involved in cell wall biosynthesis